MGAVKMSISLPEDLSVFIETFKINHSFRTRSEVIERAVTLLRAKELEEAYREASAECTDEWDTTLSDGLKDETW